jgi:hypothetical protein
MFKRQQTANLTMSSSDEDSVYTCLIPKLTIRKFGKTELFPTVDMVTPKPWAKMRKFKPVITSA